MTIIHGKLEDYQTFADVEIGDSFLFTFRDKRIPRGMTYNTWEKITDDKAIYHLPSGAQAIIHPRCDWYIAEITKCAREE